MLKIFLVVFSLGFMKAQASQEIPIQVLDAAFTKADGGYIAVKILSKSGCGNTSYSLKLRGCTDLIIPKNCFADVRSSSDQVCSGETQSEISFDNDALNKQGINDTNFIKTNLFINGSDAKKSQVKMRVDNS
jgi:hypothetical protein